MCSTWKYAAYNKIFYLYISSVHCCILLSCFPLSYFSPLPFLLRASESIVTFVRRVYWISYWKMQSWFSHGELFCNNIVATTNGAKQTLLLAEQGDARHNNNSHGKGLRILILSYFYDNNFFRLNVLFTILRLKADLPFAK